MKPKIYFDVNFFVHVLQGVDGPFGLSAEKAYSNLARGYAGTHVSVCTSHWQLTVLQKVVNELGIGFKFGSFATAYMGVVKRTKGDGDEVVITEEGYKALEEEARKEQKAPDGEDLGHLKAMIRMGVTTFVTDDSIFAYKAAKAGIEVFSTTEFIKLSNRGQFYPRQLAKAC